MIETFLRGERVRIVRGSWAEFLATVEAADSTRRWLRVAVPFFGRVVRVDLEPGDVVKVRDG